MIKKPISAHFWLAILPLTLLTIVSVIFWFLFPPKHPLVFLLVITLLFFLINGLGISIGYHRLLSHRSFKTTGLIKRALTFIGLMAAQGPPVVWAYIHRCLHHPYADKQLDPHSPLAGNLSSYIGWQVFYKEDIKNRKVIDLSLIHI